MSFENMSQVRIANERAGFYFFEPRTLRFFASRIGRTLYGGRYFITSEQFTGSDGISAPRMYTIREAEPTGNIATVGDFQAYESAADARREIKRLLASK